jgi:hypothetical protein
MAAKRVVELRKQGYRTVVDLDIKVLFDHVDHEILMRLVRSSTHAVLSTPPGRVNLRGLRMRENRLTGGNRGLGLGDRAILFSDFSNDKFVVE